MSIILSYLNATVVIVVLLGRRDGWTIIVVNVVNNAYNCVLLPGLTWVFINGYDGSVVLATRQRQW